MTWTGFDYSEQRLLWGLLGRDLPDDSRLECNLYGVRMAASGEPQLRMTMSQRRALTKPIAAHPIAVDVSGQILPAHPGGHVCTPGVGVLLGVQS